MNKQQINNNNCCYYLIPRTYTIIDYVLLIILKNLKIVYKKIKNFLEFF